VTYTLQESTDPTFATFTQTVNTVSPVAISGKIGGTYYYRVKAAKVPMADSAWTTGGNGCVVPALAISTTTLAIGGVNVAYSQAVSAVNGTAPYTWSATGLPGGLTIDQTTGIISGTPENLVNPNVASTIFPVSVTVQDSSAPPATASKVLNITINQTAPLAPSILAGTAPTSNQVVLTWQDNANNEFVVEIQRATDSGFTAGFKSEYAGGSTLTTYTDSTVIAGTTYYYRVRSGNAVAWSAFSNTATVTTP
jgi:hypothetical protein